MAEGEHPPHLFGVSLAEWEAAYDTSVVEYPATRFLVFQNGPLLRIAFGQHGHPVDAERHLSVPRYNVAVSIPPGVAIQLRDLLMRLHPPEADAPKDPKKLS